MMSVVSMSNGITQKWSIVRLFLCREDTLQSPEFWCHWWGLGWGYVSVCLVMFLLLVSFQSVSSHLNTTWILKERRFVYISNWMYMELQYILRQSQQIHLKNERNNFSVDGGIPQIWTIHCIMIGPFFRSIPPLLKNYYSRLSFSF